MKTISCKAEKFDFGGEGLFILGNSIDVSAKLKAEYAGKLDLIYLDPPFGTGESYSFSVKSGAGRAEKLQIPAYKDALDEKSYMTLMRRVLENSHALLSEQGSLYLHIDQRMNAKLRILMDEIFGAENFMNEIVWSYNSGGRSKKHFSRKHDNILFYRKSVLVYFNIAATGTPRGDKKRNNMRRCIDEDGRVYFTIRSNGKLYSYYEDSLVYPNDVWNDIEHLHQRDPERTGFYTQKPEALLKRIISASCPEGGVVADFFSGSGTTAATAAKLGRRFIAADISPLSMLLLKRRLLTKYDNVSLLEQAKPFTLEYPVYSSQVRADFARCTLNDGAAAIRLKAFDGDTVPAYMASGTVADGIFRPYFYVFDPIIGSTVELPKDVPIVMQVCDHAGAQRFYEVNR